MVAAELEITLVPAASDAAWRSSDYQKDLRRFMQELGETGLSISPRIELHESWKPETLGFIVPTYLGSFAVKALNSRSFVAIAGAAAGWLSARGGRKVRLKFGDIEVEARNREEIEDLLKVAREFQQRSD